MQLDLATPPVHSRRKVQHRERMRRHRQRQRDGRLSIAIEVTSETTDMLCRLGYLELVHLEDRRRIGEAVCQLLRNIRIDDEL